MSLAVALIEKGHLRLAGGLIGAGLARTPDDPALLWLAATVARARGDFAACRSALRRIPDEATTAVRSRALLDILDQNPHPTSSDADVAPVPFVRLENAMPAGAIQELARLALDNQHRFENSRVATDAPIDRNARSGRVWQGVEGLPAELTDMVATSLRRQAARLGVHAMLDNNFESEISAYRDGDFLAPHWDRSDGPYSSRRITTLLYFHADPAPFDGGALQLFDSGQNGRYDRAAWTGFPATGNTMLQFRSEAIHALTPVSGPSRFCDSRFCLTLWAHEAK